MSYLQKIILVVSVILWWQVAVEIADSTKGNDVAAEACEPTAAYIMNEGEIIHLTTCDIDDQNNADGGSIRDILVDAARHHAGE